jgi:nitroimidazol reductase NimA-like FMN-containing flavoprotein (pyridoxamine 5'-phosphate oxidase superfamily)
MAIVDDSRTWLIHLSEKDCWRLLDTHAVGRIGVLNDSAPEIYPVNYRTEGRSILFRTDPGSKLHGLERSPSVCFEIDGIEPATRTGWSVLVKGRARRLVDADEVRAAARHHLDYWSIGPKSHWVQIDPHEVTGRRLMPGRDTGS